MWIRNAWYVAAWSHGIASEGLPTVTIMNEPLVPMWHEPGNLFK
jgi:phenylpropionate dioxygenase-like ring-hydroxylating dioxygenase large terminal subunit